MKAIKAECNFILSNFRRCSMQFFFLLGKLNIANKLNTHKSEMITSKPVSLLQLVGIIVCLKTEK